METPSANACGVQSHFVAVGYDSLQITEEEDTMMYIYIFQKNVLMS